MVDPPKQPKHPQKHPTISTQSTSNTKLRIPIDNDAKTSSTSKSASASASPIHLDGRTLEGGGQLVRNALALSALTGKPITVAHIRGNRRGKRGLKGSHAAAVKFLTETCGGETTGGEIGSTYLTFFPRGRKSTSTSSSSSSGGEENGDGGEESSHPWSSSTPSIIQTEYNIRLSTAGSVFLIFQALYPYLLRAGGRSGSVEQPVRLHIVGGTNVSCAPSYDYVAQVLVPVLRRLGLPSLAVQLHERGWSTGPTDLGAVTFLVHPLGSDDTAAADRREVRSVGSFPRLHLSDYRRDTITRVEITILAPDTRLGDVESQGNRNRKDRRKAQAARGHDNYEDATLHDEQGSLASMTVREYLEDRASRAVARALQRLPEHVVPKRSSPDGSQAKTDSETHIPIKIHTSEATHHRTHLYLLLVAHTSNGLALGRDALFNGFKERDGRTKDKNQSRSTHGASLESSGMCTTLDELVERCVADFVEELQPEELGEQERKPCVDVFMRDQLVIFDALGRVQQGHNRSDSDWAVSGDGVKQEGEKYWSLHTQTARWVCEQILGKNLWDEG